MPSVRAQLIQRIMKDLRDASLAGVPLSERRLKFDEAARRGIRIPSEVLVRPAVVDGMPAEWIEPANATPGHFILYLHGGGYTLGSLDTHRGLVARIALASRARLLQIDYRLAPEHPFPAALEDAQKAYHWMLWQGVPVPGLVLGGDSAGGGLALATALSLRDAGEALPAALFLLSPWTDLTISGPSARERLDRDPVLSSPSEWRPEEYAGLEPLTHPLISPLFADLEDLPPMLIQVGTEEILFDDSTRLAEMAHAAGIDATIEIWEGLWHVFQGFAPYLPEAQKAIDSIGSYIRMHLEEKT
ncbi:MAG: alpha/beta hydrolase [Anaerolineales bacterium]|nr:alpha/beta hydrolase [Anaerolineales bacterium]